MSDDRQPVSSLDLSQPKSARRRVSFIAGRNITTQLNLNYVRIGTNFAPFPPRDEQEEIARFLDSKTSEVRAIIDLLGQQIDVLSDYRRSLIHEYVTGQRRVPAETPEKVNAYG